MKKGRKVHADLASAQPFPGKNHRVTHAPKAVPHIKRGKGARSHTNSFVEGNAATMPKGKGKRSRKRMASKG